MTRVNLLVLLGALTLALGGYLLKGAPGSGDLPMSMRQAALEAKIQQDPASLTDAEMLSRLERAAQAQPLAPEPHAFIGQLLAAQGRSEDAARAYQAALRRDEAYLPALRGLADLIVESEGGAVNADARKLYSQAYALDPSDVRSGMWAAMGAAQAGDDAAARAQMLAIFEALPADDPRRERFRPMIEALSAPTPKTP